MSAELHVSMKAVAAWLAALSLAFTACSPKPEAEGFSVPPRKPGTGLGLHGYNYTDLPIASYSVGSAWGGDVRVSGDGNGGSKTGCCVNVPPFLPYTYRVSWSRDDHVWCELAVEFKGPVPPNAFNFNTHFYQDGHVEISISADTEPPRVDLPRIGRGLKRHETGNVVNDTKFAKCKDER
ncbi:hypothetical protein BH11PSE9_BH11PSE9_09580 [soil metagenome]